MKQMNVIPTPFAPTLKDRMFVAVKVDFPGMVITALVGFLLSIICMMRFYYVLDSILRKCHVKISSSEPSLRWDVLDEILDHSQLTFKVQRRSVIFNLPSLKNSITRESLSCLSLFRKKAMPFINGMFHCTELYFPLPFRHWWVFNSWNKHMSSQRLMY